MISIATINITKPTAEVASLGRSHDHLQLWHIWARNCHGIESEEIVKEFKKYASRNGHNFVKKRHRKQLIVDCMWPGNPWSGVLSVPTSYPRPQLFGYTLTL